MIIFGCVLLILGWLFGVGILQTLGLILIAVGVILLLIGAVGGRPVGGRRHYF